MFTRQLTSNAIVRKVQIIAALLAVLFTFLFHIPLADAQETSASNYTVTRGTTDSSMPSPRDGNSNLNAHGFRFFCVPSHFSYDDPVVYPGQEGAAHAHMFFGNTDVNYQSTSESIVNTGGSTCDGGITNRSAYWVPALYNDADEIVLPKRINLYYKSWVPDRSQLRPVPAGLQILANGQVLGGNVVVSNVDQELWQGTTRVSDHDGLTISILFPDCVATNSDGSPVLTSTGGTSHVAFSDGAGCPSSHPYNIPQLSMHLNWDNVPFNSDWYLASDKMSDSPKGSTAHADYMAGWTEESALIMVECVRDGFRECGPPLWEHADDQFYSPDGDQIYSEFMITGDSTPNALANWPVMLSMNDEVPTEPEPEETAQDQDEETVPEEVAVVVQQEEPSADQGSTKDVVSEVKNKSKTKSKKKSDSEPVPKKITTPKDTAIPTPQYENVKTTDNLAVRSTPNGERIGKQLAGATGKIKDSTRVSLNGYDWVYVDFDNSPDGYVADAFLQKSPTQSLTNNQEEVLKLIIDLLAQIATLQALLDDMKTTN